MTGSSLTLVRRPPMKTFPKTSDEGDTDFALIAVPFAVPVLAEEAAEDAVGTWSASRSSTYRRHIALITCVNPE